MKDKERANPKRGWIGGDNFVSSHHLQWVSELLCETMELHATERTLDIACGNGNASLSAARRGCHVTGIDLAPELLNQASERAKAEHVELHLLEGDAENLPFEDSSFDVVLSTFGVMFAPDRQRALTELLRVLKPGGKIGLATWWSNTDVRIADVIDKYVPPSPPKPPINPWTNEPGLRALFGDSVSALNIIPQQVMYRFPSPSAYAETMLTRYGPWKKLADALEPGAFENLKQDLIQEVKRHNRSGDYTLVSPRDYLQVIGVKS